VSGWRKVRIGVLLLVLDGGAYQSWARRARLEAWDHSLWVAVYAIAGDDSPATAAYIAGLDDGSYAEAGAFVADEAERFGLPLTEPVRFVHSGQVPEQPPAPPASRAPLEVVWWSLGLRRWAWRMERAASEPPGEIDLFVIYHDPTLSPRVPHSLALREAQLGVVHAFADPRQARPNQVVIVHELLHVFGATDKYEDGTLQPIFPDGYAEPDAEPRYPQTMAEVMGGRIPSSPTRAEIPRSLAEVVVGPRTATEIGWTPEAAR